MNRLKPLFKKLAIVFGAFACLILLPCLYLSVRQDAEYPIYQNPLYIFVSVRGLGLLCLTLFAVCFALSGWDHFLRRLTPPLKKIALGIGILIAVLMVFFLEENIRGRIALRSYERQLRTQGEKLTLAEFDLPKPLKDGNGVAALMALTNQLDALRNDCPFDPGSIVSRVRLVGLGQAVVCCQQPDLGVNRRGLAAAGRGRRGRDFEEAETIATAFVPVKADWADLDGLVARASNVLEQIQQASARPASSVEIDYAQGFDVRVPHLQPIRSAANWLGLAALDHLYRRNFEAATQNIVAIAGLSQFGRDERLVISQVRRWQCGMTGLNLTWEALQLSGWTDEQLSKLEQAWRESSVIQHTSSVLEMERLFYRHGFERARQLPWWTALRSCLFDRGRGDSPPADFGEFVSDLQGGLHAVAWRLAWLDQDELRFLRRYQLMLGRARTAIANRDWSAFGPSDKEFPYARSFYDRRRFLLSDAYTPSIELILSRVFGFETQREMTIAAIGIKRYQLRTGKLPSDLTVLMPEYLPQLPHDWMDGKPLRYRANPDGTFTLYSVGLDGRDDDGDSIPSERKRAFSIWNGRDAVWPMPASEEDISAFERQTKQILNAGRRGLRSGK